MNINSSHNIFKYSLYSISAHLSLIFVAIILTKLFVFDKKSENINLKLIQTSVRVDIVEMPKYTIKELKTMAPPSVKKKKVIVNKRPKSLNKNPVKFKKKARKKTRNDFLSMLSSMGQLETTKIKKKNNALDSHRSDLKKLLLAGNKISEARALYGKESDVDNSIFSIYISVLPDHVRPNWKLPSYLADKDFKCRIQVFLKENGELQHLEIFESSGNLEYDKRAIEAVKKSSPFDQVPKEISERAYKGDIILGFPL